MDNYKNEENIDYYSSDLYPLNTKAQAEVLQLLNALECHVRMTQLIKEVNIKVEVKYLPKGSLTNG